MQRDRRFTSPLPYLLALWLGCGKCTASPAQDLPGEMTPESGPSGPSAPEALDAGLWGDLTEGGSTSGWFIHSEAALLNGEEDTGNHYPSTVNFAVRVTGHNLRRMCAGVLIGPRLVLTAGYCVASLPR
jgi:trypsin